MLRLRRRGSGNAEWSAWRCSSRDQACWPSASLRQKCHGHSRRSELCSRSSACWSPPRRPARPGVRIIAWPFVAVVGVKGNLARQNALRVPRRTAATASALMIGLVVVAGISVLASRVKANFTEGVSPSTIDHCRSTAAWDPQRHEVLSALCRNAAPGEWTSRYGDVMTGIPSTPPVGSGLDAVCDIARRRALGWAMFGQMFTAPTHTWVDDLRSGAVRRRLEAAIGWRAGELEDFGPPMLVVGAYERSARRRTREDDLERLAAAFVGLADADILDAAQGACELLHQLGEDEVVAWSSGRLPRARELRVHQDRELRGEAGDRLELACAVVVDGVPREPYLSLGRLCRLWVDRERSGSSFADNS